jgi:hypothetical protein
LVINQFIFSDQVSLNQSPIAVRRIGSARKYPITDKSSGKAAHTQFNHWLVVDGLGKRCAFHQRNKNLKQPKTSSQNPISKQNRNSLLNKSVGIDLIVRAKLAVRY